MHTPPKNEGPPTKDVFGSFPKATILSYSLKFEQIFKIYILLLHRLLAASVEQLLTDRAEDQLVPATEHPGQVRQDKQDKATQNCIKLLQTSYCRILVNYPFTHFYSLQTHLTGQTGIFSCFTDFDFFV